MVRQRWYGHTYNTSLIVRLNSNYIHTQNEVLIPGANGITGVSDTPSSTLGHVGPRAHIHATQGTQGQQAHLISETLGEAQVHRCSAAGQFEHKSNIAIGNLDLRIISAVKKST